MALVWVLATFFGLIAWAFATRLCVEVYKIGTLRWAFGFLIIVILVSALIGIAVGIKSGGVLGIAPGLGIVGLFVLIISAGSWWQAKVAQVAGQSLHARFAQDPDLEIRFRRHWFFRRINKTK